MDEATLNPRAVNCKFCGGDFKPGRLAGHEQECEKKTPEERKKTTDARIAYRKNYSLAAANGAGATAQRYVDRVIKKPRKATLAVMTPKGLEEQRRQVRLKKQREYYAKYGRGGKSALEREVKKASTMLNGKRRVQITLSLDWDTLREFIIQVAPDVVVDKVELVS